MSQLLESESDAGSSSSTTESSKSQSIPFTVRDELEQYSTRLNLLGLDSGEQITSSTQELRNLESSDDNDSSTVESNRAHTAPVSTSAILGHLSVAGDQALKKMAEREQELPTKIPIRFKPIGSVPQVAPQLARISASQPFSVVVTFLTKRLKLNNVYCYINNSFSPAPQQSVGDLWGHFRIKDELVVSYCSGVAFG